MAVVVAAGVVALPLLWNMLMALMVSPPPRELRINVVMMQSKQQTVAASKLASTTPTIASMHETPVMEVAVVVLVVMCQGYNNNVQ